ncbi:MAG TPA: c-type cytochrome [Vicinamibacteria bacterium]
MRRVLLVLLILVALALAGGAWMLSRGFSARVEPSRLEAAVARRLRHLAVPRGARQAKNPVAMTPEVLHDGLEHFADHCAVCHANDGGGKTTLGENTYPRAPDMRLPETQRLSDGELFYIIENGVRFTAMPGWGNPGPEDDADTWALVHFIRHLPQLTPDELEHMHSLNPKSAEDWEAEQFLGEQGGATAHPPDPPPSRPK